MIVCCSPTDTETVKPACDALRIRGYAVEELFGVAEEPERLAGAIRRHEGLGLYVLCRSDALDRVVIDKLRGVLRSHEVPFGRTLTLAIEAGKPRVLEDRIVSVLRRMVTGRPPPVPTAVGASSISDVRAAPPEEVVTGVDASEIAAWAESLTRGQRVSEPERPRASEAPRASMYPVDGLGGGVDPRPEVSHPVDDLPPEIPLNDEAKTEPITSPSHVSRPLQPVVPASSLRPVNPFVPAPATAMDGASAASIVNSRELDPAEASRNRFLAIGLTGLGAVLLIGLAVATFGRDETEDAVAAQDEPAPAPEALDPEPKPASNEAPEAVPTAPAERSPAPSPPADEAPEAAPAKDLPDAPAVVRALQSRDVRALDTLIVTAERTKPKTHAAAASYCERLVVSGLGGWRLPEIGELDAIGKADMLRPGIYWSETFGDVHGDARMVFNTKRSRIGSVKVGWDGAHAVCVRLRS